MSKCIKQADYSVDQPRTVTPVLRSRKININPNISNPKLIIGKHDGPYMHIKPLSRAQSSSNIKQRLTAKKISPNRSPNASIVLKSDDSKQSNVFEREVESSNFYSKNNSSRENKRLIDDKSYYLQKYAVSLEKKLEELTEKNGVGPKKQPKKNLEVFKKTFSEVIENDKIFSGVLKIIKGFYEKIIEKNSEKKLRVFKEKLKEVSKELSNQLDRNKLNEKKIEKLVKENKEFKFSLSRSEEMRKDLQEKIYNITNYDVSDMPRDEEMWRALVLENRNYYETNKLLIEDIKTLQTNEKKFVNFVFALKEKGYPVDEIYQNTIQTKYMISSYSGSELLESNTETENLFSGRPAMKDKPDSVPLLDFNGLPQESFTSSSMVSNSYSSYYTDDYS